VSDAAVVNDHSRTMDETSWWDLWNSSYRAHDQLDPVSSELFIHAAALINDITQAGQCRVLEVACGTGTLSRMIACSTYEGLDLSPAAVQVARERAASIQSAEWSGLRKYEVADFCDWMKPADAFDLVVCIDAIACIRDQGLALRKMANVLKIGGRLVLTTVNRFVYERIRRSSSVRLENGPVSRWLSRGELRQMVIEAGFTIERFGTIMPRGNEGVLRLINSYKLNNALGPDIAARLRRLKESAGLGQYTVVVARKRSPVG
jgi:2-polyprenyl-3-methyl-5-hydroxy-6-metoxy-1,4-benzoquinol methylase